MTEKPTIEETAKAITEALQEVARREAEYQEAKQAASFAGLRETEALNALNQKQKEVDRLMNDMRAAASGDWRTDPQKQSIEYELSKRGLRS